MFRHPSLLPTALVLALGAAAPAAAQPPETGDVCFPEEVAYDRLIYLTAEMDVLVDSMWLSVPQQQERIDFTLSPTQAVRSYQDYLAETRYIVILAVDPGTGQSTVTSCTTTSIEGPLERQCLAHDALPRGDLVAGGVFPVESYVLPSVSNPDLVQFDYVVARLGSETVPVRVLARTVQASQSLVEFVNYRFEVDPSVFDLPPECVEARAPTASATTHLRDLLGPERVEALSQLPGFRWLVESPAGP
jgi:hypothetical protein